MSPSTPSSSSTNNTPALAGVWQRVFEEDPLGDAAGADRDTLVLWTQAPESGIYVDLRLPKNSPGRIACCPPRPAALAATGMSGTAKQLLLSQRDDSGGAPHYYDALLQQKSFAGVLDSQLGDTTESGAALKNDVILKELADHAAASDRKHETAAAALPLNTCFWRRDMDYQPPAGLDIGVCASQIPFADGSVLLRETGDDASYAEGWLRLAGTDQGPFMALELQSEQRRNNNNNNEIMACARKGFWVRTHNRFAYAVGYPVTTADAQRLQAPEASAKIKECKNQSLADALESLMRAEKDPQNVALDVLGSYVAATGEIVTSGDGDSTRDAKWMIHYSTHPELVGCELVGLGESCCSTLVQPGDNFGLVEQKITLEDGSIVKRVWKVIELTAGCDMPLCV